MWEILLSTMKEQGQSKQSLLITMHLILKLERGNEWGLFMEAKSQSGWWECPEQSSPSEENCSLQVLPTSSFPTVHSHRLGAVRGVCMLSCVWLFAIPWTTLAHQVPLSMEFSRQKYWAKLPLPTPGDLPNPGIESESFVYPAFSVGFFFFFFFFFTTSSLRKPTATGRVPLLKMLCWILKVWQLRAVGQQVSSQILYF